MGKCVHSQSAALPQLAAALCSRKWEGFLSIPARKVYILANSVNKKSLPPHNVSDTKFCPSVGAVMWKIENLSCLTPWVCFTSGEPNPNQTCLKMEAYVFGRMWKKDTFFHVNIFTFLNKLFGGFMENKEFFVLAVLRTRLSLLLEMCKTGEHRAGCRAPAFPWGGRRYEYAPGTGQAPSALQRSVDLL